MEWIFIIKYEWNEDVVNLFLIKFKCDFSWEIPKNIGKRDFKEYKGIGRFSCHIRNYFIISHWFPWIKLIIGDNYLVFFLHSLY